MKNIEDLEAEVKHLRKLLEKCKHTLELWDKVHSEMLYPHQHNTGSINRKTLAEVKKVICPKKN